MNPQLDSNSEKEELHSLLSNISKGIDAFGVRKLNSALCTILVRNGSEGKAISLVISAVCAEFNIAPTALKSKYSRGKNDDHIRAKEVCYCILHFELGMTTRAIYKAVVDGDANSHTIVYQIIKKYRTINKAVKTDVEFQKHYDNVWTAVKSKITDTE